MKTDSVELLLVATIMAIHVGFGNSKFVMVPQGTVAVIGRLAYFNCSTSDIQSQNIHWKYNEDHVYAGGRFLAPYDKRFRIEIDNSTGSCNLVIPNVTKDDAGKYRCFDDKGFGEERGAELIVLDAEPMCTSDMKTDGIVGPNSCNVDLEDIRLSCSVTYNGNIVPMLKWTRIGVNSPINTGITICKNSTKRVECNLTVKANLHLDGSSFVCHTDTTMSINCISDPIKIIYNKTATLIPEPPPSGKATPCEDSDKTTVIIIVVTIFVILLVACIIILLLCYLKLRKEKKKRKSQQKAHEEQQLITISKEQEEVEMSRLRNELRNEQISREADRQETERLKNELQSSKDRIEKLHEQILDSENERLTKEAERDQQKADLEDRIKSGKNKIEELEKQINDRENKLLTKEGELKQKADLEERLKSEVNDLKTKLEEVEGTKRTLEEEIKRLVERKNELGRSLYLPPKEPSDYKIEHHQTIQTQAVERDKKLGTCGVAVLDNELFVITDAHPEVEVYDLSTFEHSRNIKLYYVFDPGDIVACHKTKRIYIVDWTERNLENKLLRLDSSGKEDIQRLSLTDDECRLSLTKDANILVTFYRSRKIIEYNPDWNVVHQTKIKHTNIYPIHAVKLSNGHLAICYGIDKERTHRVCIMDNDGSLLKSFGGPKGAGVGQVDFPTYLAVDKNDSILVTDRNNGRVMLLNSRLELTAELLSKKNTKVRLPRTLLVDETNSRLFIADCDEGFYNGQILIFNLK